MPAMRAQASSVYIAVITISASVGPILVSVDHTFIKTLRNVYCRSLPFSIPLMDLRSVNMELDILYL